MKSIGRATLCLTLLTAGVAAQAGLDAWSRIDRPPLRRSLASLPMNLGDWSGHDIPIDPDIRDRSQGTEVLSRVYENPKYPGVALSLWLNFSVEGTNMRHSPDVCLPSHGWSRVESMGRIYPVDAPDGRPVRLNRLAYSKAELVQSVGFWYYIFGEGAIEQWVRTLPITSRSSHGRTTRGSGLTVEVFWRSETDPESDAFLDFAQALLGGLDPIMPADRAGYHVP